MEYIPIPIYPMKDLRSPMKTSCQRPAPICRASVNTQYKVLLHKRSLIETVNDQLKTISQIEHARHRARANFLVNLIAGLIASTYQEKKLALQLRAHSHASDPTALLVL